MITVAPALSAADRRAFLAAPGRFMRDDPNWIEPLALAERRRLDPAWNPVVATSEIGLWLARENGRAVGRISAQLPAAGSRRDADFGLLAAERPEVVPPLLAAAEAWARARGAARLRGPFSLSINQVSGALVEGFDTPPQILMDHGPRWLGAAIEAAGMTPVRDLIAYRMDVAQGLPERQRRLARRPVAGLTLRPLDWSRYDAEIATVTRLFNDAWAGNWGFRPLSEAETRALARDLKPILDPDLVRFAEFGGEAQGFIVVLANVNEALRGLGGRLLPFGWARLLWRLKVAGVRSARVPLMGVARAAQQSVVGKALPLLMIGALEDRIRARGIRELELSWILAENLSARRVVEDLGARVAKVYRVYERRLG